MSYSRWETPSELTASTLAKHDFRRFVGGAYGVLAGQTIGFDNFLDLVCAGEAYEIHKNTAGLKEALEKHLPGATWSIHQGEPELSTEDGQASIVSSPGREYLIQINTPFCTHPVMVTKHITRFSDGSGDLSTLWVYNLQDSVLNIVKTAQAITDAYQDCFKRVRQINIYRGDAIPLPPHTWADWDTVFVSPEVAANVKDDIQFFLNNKEEFTKVGIPYKRGYLLHGPAGCGKTTMARVIATSMPFSSFAFDFSNPKMTNQDLTAAFAWAAKSAPAVFFMEDIDRVWASDSDKRSLVTLDHLLNCIDGIATNDGLIVFASANCPEKIDPAIINRPGRFDQVVKVDLPDYDLRLRYLTWLFRLTPASAETLEWVAEQTQGVSMAHLKEIFVVSMKNYVMSKKDNGDDHELSIRNAVSRVLEMFGGVSSKNTRRAGFGT